MIERNIKVILEDLYAIDPSLRQKEQELSVLIEKLLTLRPETRFDQAFARNLRGQLLASSTAAEQGTKHMSLIERIFSKPMFVAATGAIVVIAAILTLQDGLFQKIVPRGETQVVSYTTAGENAFGSLKEMANTPAAPQATESMAVGMGGGRPQSGGGSGVAMSAPADSKASPMIYPAPEMVNYHFVYKGEEFELPGAKVQVYRKVKGGFPGGDVSAIIGAAAGLLDFSTFGSTRVQNVSFYEDRDGGYQIYVDLYEGLVQISERFPKYMEPQTFRVPDMPSKAQMISAANDFLRERGVNMDGYGDPEIQEWWMQTMAGGPEVDAIRIADAGVVYPLLIDGKKALDQSGNATGLTVNIRLSDMKVTGLWNLSTRRYESSAYPAENDREKILEWAERGGINNYYYPAYEGQPAKTIDVEIGTPTLAYIQYWKYNGADSNELYIPAYLFPVESGQGEQIWQKFVVVPIVSELIDSVPPYPMPLMEKSTSPGGQ